jgi:hypothetical protein
MGKETTGFGRSKPVLVHQRNRFGCSARHLTPGRKVCKGMVVLVCGLWVWFRSSVVQWYDVELHVRRGICVQILGGLLQLCHLSQHSQLPRGKQKLERSTPQTPIATCCNEDEQGAG